MGCYSFLYLAYFLETSVNYVLDWIFREKLVESICFLFVKFIEDWGLFKFFQRFDYMLQDA